MRTLEYWAIPAGLLWVLSANGQEWKTARKEGAFVLEKRDVAGEKFQELRVRTYARGTPEQFVTYLMGRYLAVPEHGIRRQWVKRTSKQAEWTDLIEASLVGERCTTIRMTAAEPTTMGETVVTFGTTGDWPVGKPKEGCVPLRTKGAWVLRANGTQTEITYTVFTDIGGRLPPFLIRGPIEEDTWKRVKRVIAEVAR